MPFVIDGHNLIGKMPDISLSDLDDELALINQLKVFCRVRRQRVEVFFDRAPARQSGKRGSGAVKAHFVRTGKTADAAIEEFLERLKGEASNWTVVSSDNRVQRAAQAAHARWISSEEFSQKLASSLDESLGPPEASTLDENQMREWLHLFGDETD